MSEGIQGYVCDHHPSTMSFEESGTCSRASELVGSRPGLPACTPVAVGNEERDGDAPNTPPPIEAERRLDCDVGLDALPSGMPIGAEWPGGDALCPGIWMGGVPFCAVAACGTISGFGIVVPTDCFGARPALDSA